MGGELPVPHRVGRRPEPVSIIRPSASCCALLPWWWHGETITVQVEPEISNVDYSLSVTSGGVSVPGLKTRRGSTTLQLKDGQTFVMAGLLQEDLSTVVPARCPFLGDIPYLGSLFTSKEFQKNESELMIIVTPRLVRALNADGSPSAAGRKGHGRNRRHGFLYKKPYGTDSPR